MTRPRLRTAGVALTAVSVAAVAWFTLRPDPTPGSAPPDGCCFPVDIVQNLLLFLPVGAGLALLGLRARTVTLLGALFSAAVEASQSLWIDGRDASLGDVAANVVGSLLGILVVARWSRRARWWRWVAPVIAVAVVFWWLGVAFLVRPMVPGSYLWNTRWADSSAHLARFTGRVLSVTFQRRPLAEGSLPEREVERLQLSQADTFRLSTTVVTGPVIAGRVRLASIAFGTSGREYMSLWLEGRRLLAFQRLNFNIRDHQGVWVSLENAVPSAVGDTVRITLTAARNRVRLLAATGGALRQASLRLSPELYFGPLLVVTNQTIDRISWWSVILPIVSFLLLGSALASPAGLAVGAAASLLLGPVLMESAPASWPILLVAILAAWAGRRLALGLELFGGNGRGAAKAR